MKNFIRKIDRKVLNYIQSANRPLWLDMIFIAFTRSGDYGWIWVIIAIWIYAVYDHFSTAALLLIALFSVILFSEFGLKYIFRRNRPFKSYTHLTPPIKVPRSFSFPSGHTALSFSAVVVLYLSYPQSLLLHIWTLILALCISFSRIYLRVHYPSDVIVGAIVGSIIGFVVFYFLQYFV